MTGTYFTVLQYDRILGLGYGINIYHIDISVNNHTTGKIPGTEKYHCDHTHHIRRNNYMCDSDAELETRRKTAQET